MPKDPLVCVVGLGYVGLPLAHAFAKAGMETYGYDVDRKRIEELEQSKDRTRELSEIQLREVSIKYSADPSVIEKADIVILAIPTPVTEDKNPDLSLLTEATKTVGKHFKDGATIVYESTVYPGVTEEICRPILRKESGGKSFSLGYSPERINPGDREHTIDRIVKVVSGEDKKTTDLLVELYGNIVPAGIHRAPSIKVAEMAKAIENAQRDLNIAYINEIAMLCNALGIATKDVLNAAGTKWSFLPFQPGLVGGHCIGVDPYYLVAKARQLGMETQVITAGRATNDGMAQYIVRRVLEELTVSGIKPEDAQVLVMGLTFKENVPDTRNSKALEVVKFLKMEGCMVTTHDPYIDENDALMQESSFDAILLLVPHRAYAKLSAKDLRELGKKQCLFYDLKSLYSLEDFEKEGMTYLAL